jgi:hypothetical protein
MKYIHLRFLPALAARREIENNINTSQHSRPHLDRPRTARMAAALVAATFLPGCTTLPSHQSLLTKPVSTPHRLDARAHFRQQFCARYGAAADAGAPACDYWLWRLPDEPEAPAAARSESSGAEAHYQVVIVPGAFGECFGTDAEPFPEGAAALRSRGIAISVVRVEGRSGTQRNAKILAAWLEQNSTANVPLILIGYSKGIADILQYTVDFPDAARRVKAVVSIAGATAGTPIADADAALFDATLSHLPNPQCGAGDGRVVDDLRHDVRSAWLAQHALPAHIRYFSVAAFTTRERMARALMPAWRKLLATDAHNDGQVLVRDSVIPGSTLLGFVNADHWETAFAMEKRFGFLAGRQATSRFPRQALLEAVLSTVGESLSE